MTDIVKELKERYGKVTKSNNGYYAMPCPTCTPKDAKHRRRYYKPGNATSQCFICGIRLTLEDLLGFKPDQMNLAIDVEEEEKPHPMSRHLPFRIYHPINTLGAAHPAVQFLAKDHLTDLQNLWDDYKIGYIPYEGGMEILFDSGGKVLTSDSLIFPVVFNGTLVGWQCRFIPGTRHGDKMGKFRYFHVFKKSEYVFNYDKAKQYDEVIVVEGVKKALKLPNAVATLGKCISEKQEQIIQEWKKIVLVLDGEDSTQYKALELQRKFQANSRKCISIDLRKYGAASPDDITTERFKEILQVEQHI